MNINWSNGHLKLHVQTHPGDKWFNCIACRASFLMNNCLKKHIERHTRTNLFDFKECGYVFSRVADTNCIEAKKKCICIDWSNLTCSSFSELWLSEKAPWMLPGPNNIPKLYLSFCGSPCIRTTLGIVAMKSLYYFNVYLPAPWSK